MSGTVTQRSSMTHYGSRTTLFGAVETPHLLSNLPTGNLMKVDTLVCLQYLWGKEMLADRELLYRVVAGTVTTEEYQLLICKCYELYTAFTNYVDECYVFGENEIPLIRRIILPARERIDNYATGVIAAARKASGKVVGRHKDYLYILYPDGISVNFEGCTKC